MNVFGTPDLLSSSILSRGVARVNADILRSAEELSSGRKADKVAASGGDPSRLYALERDLSRAETAKATIDLAAGRSAQMQVSMERVQGALGEVGVPVLAAVTRGDISAARVEAGAARGAFEATVAALNTRFGDRSLFAAASVEGPALASADSILSEIGSRIAAAATSADVIAAIDLYFVDAGGFATTGYSGSTIDLTATDVGDGQSVSYAVRADALAFRDALSGLALAVVGAEGGWPGSSDSADGDLLAEASRRSLAAQEDVIDLRATIGIAEERIQEASVRNEAKTTFLTSALNSILARDPFEAATEFTALETQLQSVFSVTARLSTLNLTNFLR